MRLFAFALLLGAVVYVSGQTTTPTATGIVSGTVTDGLGAPVPAADVVLRRRRSPERTTRTGAGGEFRFEAVPDGTYDLQIRKAGFALLTSRVDVGSTTSTALTFTLAAVPTTQPPPPLNPAVVDRTREHRKAPAAVPTETVNAMPSAGLSGAGRMGSLTLRAPDRDRFNTEAYTHIEENRFRRVADDPLSTFSIDVDTASYANVRRFLNQGQLPPADAVRVEELINYFRFDYADARDDEPFSVTTELAACPWNPRHRLALVGLQARRMTAAQTPPRNLVFLLDVSGSMASADKLPLVKNAMTMLAGTLTAADRVAIVVYAGASGVVLHSTPGSHKTEIRRAIAELEPGGSTNGAAGIKLAYDLAARARIPNGINRVILATDGDFNVGVTSEGELIRLIEEKRERGIFLSVLGVGTGNLKDSTMEQLADKGNGNYSYLDSLQEARRVLVAEAGATLTTVAKDVKIQVEFNPRAVSAYKLIGYENRVLQHEDFNDDRKDAGEIGAGHSVTALYEIVPDGEEMPGKGVDPLRYQSRPEPGKPGLSGELMTVKLRYKAPNGSESRLIVRPVANRTNGTSSNLGFAAAVAEFGMLLRNSEHKGGGDVDQRQGACPPASRRGSGRLPRGTGAPDGSRRSARGAVDGRCAR